MRDGDTQTISRVTVSASLSLSELMVPVLLFDSSPPVTSAARLCGKCAHLLPVCLRARVNARRTARDSAAQCTLPLPALPLAAAPSSSTVWAERVVADVGAYGAVSVCVR